MGLRGSLREGWEGDGGRGCVAGWERVGRRGAGRCTMLILLEVAAIDRCQSHSSFDREFLHQVHGRGQEDALVSPG